MWIFTRRAFLSVVKYDPAQAVADLPQGDYLLVRGRVREDVEDLRSVVPDLVVDEDDNADYRYRAVVTRQQWKSYLLLSADEIDYRSHFKEVVRGSGATQPELRYRAMLNVWHDMLALQPPRKREHEPTYYH